MRMHRAMLATVAVAAPVALGASPAWAAAPSNDVFSGAAPLSVGTSLSLDTTQATTDADDAQLNASCGAPATDASVWYSYSPAADGAVVVDVSSSTYAAGVLVATGTQGSLTSIACGPGAVVFSASAGTTYSILVIDDQVDGGGNGGTLNLSMSGLPDAPTVAVTVDPVGFVNAKTGAATLSGTITCANADFVSVFGQLSPVAWSTITIGPQSDTPHS